MVALVVAAVLAFTAAPAGAFQWSNPAYHEDKGVMCLPQSGNGLVGRVNIQRANLRAINATTAYDTQSVQVQYIVMRWDGAKWYPYNSWRHSPVFQAGEDSWTSLAQVGGPVGDLTGDLVDIQHTGYYAAGIHFRWFARPEINLAYAEDYQWVEWYYGPYFTNPTRTYCSFF